MGIPVKCNSNEGSLCQACLKMGPSLISGDAKSIEYCPLRMELITTVDEEGGESWELKILPKPVRKKTSTKGTFK